MKNTQSKFFSVVIFALPALAGAIGLLAATPYGIGIYSDSTMYLLTARSLLLGHGYTIDGIPVAIFPPLYPALLAISGLSGADPIDAARWLQSIIWAFNILWVTMITFRFSEKSVATSIVASILMLGSVDMIAYHSLALSDGAFLFFSLPAFLALNIYLEKEKSWYLIASALLFALASLTRYVGLAWIIGGILSILLLSRKSIKGKFLDVLLFGMISSTPGALWALRNMQYETVMGRTLDLHPFWGNPEFTSLVHTVSAWVFQWTVPDSPWLMLIPVFSAAWLLKRMAAQQRNVPGEFIGRFYLLFIFVLSFAAVLVFSAAFVQADLFRDSTRLMMPLHAMILIMALMAGKEWFKRIYPDGNRRQVIGMWVLFILGVFFVATGVRYIIRVSVDGQGYASVHYRYSPLMNAIKNTPQGITIYSNLDLPVALYTGKMLMSIPEKINNTTQRSNEQYNDQMKSMASDIRDSSAILVYFTRKSDWLVYPSLDEIQRFVALHCRDTSEDGAVYEAVPDTSEDE
jgi:hypothetical protein